MRPGAKFAHAAALAALALLVSGCVSSAPPSTSWCVPRIFVEPAVVSPGETITMSSDSSCDAPQPSGGWSVLVAPVGHPDEGVRTAITDDFDGSFSVTVTIPLDFPTGEAFAAIDNWDYSPCDDTNSVGGNASCAGASGSFIVR